MLALTTGCICGSAQNFLLSGRDGPVTALSLSEGALGVWHRRWCSLRRGGIRGKDEATEGIVSSGSAVRGY
jgi:hypothetical protein